MSWNPSGTNPRAAFHQGVEVRTSTCVAPAALAASTLSAPAHHAHGVHAGGAAQLQQRTAHPAAAE